MKTLNPAPKFLIYAVSRALRHPRTPITYGYCSECKVRVPGNAGECPKCKKKLSVNPETRQESPETRQESPVPWWGSILCIVLGIICWVLGATLEIAGLDEAGRVLVYIPLGNLFGMSIALR